MADREMHMFKYLTRVEIRVEFPASAMNAEGRARTKLEREQSISENIKELLAEELDEDGHAYFDIQVSTLEMEDFSEVEDV